MTCSSFLQWPGYKPYSFKLKTVLEGPGKRPITHETIANKLRIEMVGFQRGLQVCIICAICVLLVLTSLPFLRLSMPSWLTRGGSLRYLGMVASRSASSSSRTWCTAVDLTGRWSCGRPCVSVTDVGLLIVCQRVCLIFVAVFALFFFSFLALSALLSTSSCLPARLAVHLYFLRSSHGFTICHALLL